ncbi:MAG: sigma-70 family RNA polymerase sigma factor, partial [Clostridia bacterium]
KNIKLATYASRCIENEILMLLRKTTKRKGEISIDEPLGGGEGDNILLLSDILCNEDDEVGTEVEKGAEKEIIWGCLEHLNEREQEIMKLRFGLGGIDEKTQKEVAELLGISQSYISRIEKKILFRLRKDLLKIM